VTPEVQAILREPFPPEKVGKLPRVTCGKCRDSRDRSCENHAKSKCHECSNYITAAHMHLDYVGHADVTDRFLQADPDWTWEPLALDPKGLPALDENGGLWIRLTIAGTTRLGYGDADGKRGGNAIKEVIGDALRNASMRFGVALDLWRKEGPAEEQQAAPKRGRPQKPEPAAAVDPRFDELAKRLAAAETEAALKAAWELVVAAYKADEITTVQANSLRADLADRKAALV